MIYFWPNNLHAGIRSHRGLNVVHRSMWPMAAVRLWSECVRASSLFFLLNLHAEIVSTGHWRDLPLDVAGSCLRSEREMPQDDIILPADLLIYSKRKGFWTRRRFFSYEKMCPSRTWLVCYRIYTWWFFLRIRDGLFLCMSFLVLHLNVSNMIVQSGCTWDLAVSCFLFPCYEFLFN